MKVRATIVEEVKPADKSVIVEFHGDKERQHFELHCNFSPFYQELKLLDSWIFTFKLKSEIFTDSKTGKKSYFTHLICKRVDDKLGFGEIPDKYK
ncbi:hypothetical protein NZ698_00605 [Chryseobacterium sp. PBS4-4]|uniref:DUF3127 domain-containing protein n=1 Tax=Chryseobacterium edaphi TaxID=2976532 RepID=A0ABT2W0G1_9FLAO|nr:hypothetical protein [Chryseobacterium edaphi]MCU7615681.1 hypothetical protein [Chryseobacterium edaphi]